MTKRCDCCKKKLGIMVFDCKCELKLCINCRYPETHKCTFDHKTFEKNIII